MLLSKPASTVASARFLDGYFVSRLPVDPVGSDLTAGDSGTSRAVLFGVPSAAEAVVVRVLVHSHRLVQDAWLGGRGPEAWLLR